jgi:hypothetical protein
MPLTQVIESLIACQTGLPDSLRPGDVRGMPGSPHTRHASIIELEVLSWMGGGDSRIGFWFLPRQGFLFLVILLVILVFLIVITRLVLLLVLIFAFSLASLTLILTLSPRLLQDMWKVPPKLALHSLPTFQ